jgi:hypothetical protein
MSGVLAAVAPAAASAAGAQTLNLKVLLIGEGPACTDASADPTTCAWQAALDSQGVPYDEVKATGTVPNEQVNLPTLSSGDTGNYNGVVIADSPANYAPGQLTPLFNYESTFAVRQVDGYMFPSPDLGVTDVTSSSLNGTPPGTLTSDGLAAFPELKGPIPFDSGSRLRGHVHSGGAYTPPITDSAGDAWPWYSSMRPATPRRGVGAAFTLDYNANDPSGSLALG